MGILLKGGIIYTGEPVSDGTQMDILIEDGMIKDQQRNINPEELGKSESEQLEIIDVSGLTIVPGLVDMHVHLREPGFEYKETIATGTKSAARGGFTSIACMPNTKPTADNSGTIEFIKQRAKEQGLVHTYPIAALTVDRVGKEIVEMDDLYSAGAVAFSDDGSWVHDSGVMRTALEYSQLFNVPVISHCEDEGLSDSGQVNEGYLASVMGLSGIPNESESIAVARDVMLSELTGAHLHIAHISTAQSVDIIRKAKDRGVPVTAEVTPHHLILTDSTIQNYNTMAKVNPPLRTEEDVKALRQGIKEGVIDCIATDHAPHSTDEKNVEFDNAPFGLVGLETAFSVSKKALVDSGVLSLSELIEKMSTNPAKLLKLPSGKLVHEAPADLTILSLDEKYTVNPGDFASLGKNSPFAGWELEGKIVATMVSGEFSYRQFGSDDHVV
ncbi:dihydroorotase [Natranaerobius thermophilus]|uniref:Dihydroorotase n=1 Tax=Natranaerobius thermophilus (strain ATCC BAA-1301 / DSM 18059 / JW/NM-WN-LF) TaxID=457570 RepID=B2A2U6_NATTJ|nr:dihydroorotase [Natranaerobius thermophilus]ACB86314.1 dihydroorotase, multifunctional complex type [Natranaerobius thermophilus JW/NM-WN-LF]